MKFGICYCYWNKNWEGNDYPVYIERARRCGFDALEIVYGRTMEMGQAEVDEIRAACAANDVELFATGGFGPDMDVSALDEDQRKAAVDKCLVLLKALSRLDIHNFSGINYGRWCGFDDPIRKDEMFEQSAKSLKVIGHAEIRQLFKASGVGTIAGSYVTDGIFQRGCKVRITREGEQIFEGALASLKRFKDDVKEVKAGYECGLVFEGFNDQKEEDQVEAYIMVEVPR